MTMPTNPVEPVEVEQCDREAALRLLDILKIREHETGTFRDWDGTVQAFARHRLAAQQPAPALHAPTVEACVKVVLGSGRQHPEEILIRWEIASALRALPVTPAEGEKVGSIRKELSRMANAADEINGEIDRQIDNQKRVLGGEWSNEQTFVVELTWHDIEVFNREICRAQAICNGSPVPLFPAGHSDLRSTAEAREEAVEEMAMALCKAAKDNAIFGTASDEYWRRLAIVALALSPPDVLAECREVLGAIKGAMLNGGDGAKGDFGWIITKLNKARPAIRALLAERDAASARVGEIDQKRRRLEAALRVARGYVLRATDEQSFRDQVTIDAALEIKA